MIYETDLGVRVTKVRNGWAFNKNRVFESVDILGPAIRADFVPQCIMEVCRTGRLNFSLSFLHILSALFDIQMKRSRRTHEFIIQVQAYCYQSKIKMIDMASCSLTFKLRLLFQSFCMLAFTQIP